VAAVRVARDLEARVALAQVAQDARGAVAGAVVVDGQAVVDAEALHGDRPLRQHARDRAFLVVDRNDDRQLGVGRGGCHGHEAVIL
jgi:hypothetical protein